MSRGHVVILSGPSGVGKDTVIDAWVRVNPRVKRVVAYTTRASRVGEIDGVDYNFVSVDEFHRLAADGAFLEFKEVHGNFYATPLGDLQRMLAANLVAILKIDVQGALAAMVALPDAISVFLLPPDSRELEERLRSRGTDDDASIERRLANARAELSLAAAYQHQVVNGTVDAAVQCLEAIIAKAPN